jgi:hypothetical protein
MSLGAAGVVPALDLQGGEPDSPSSSRTVIFHPHGRKGSLGPQGGGAAPGPSSRLGLVGARAGRWLGLLVGGPEEARGGEQPRGLPLGALALAVLLLALAVQVWFGAAWFYGGGRAQQQQQQPALLLGPEAVHAGYWLQHLQHLQQEMQLLQSRMELVSREMQAAMGQISTLAQLQQQQQQQQPGAPP